MIAIMLVMCLSSFELLIIDFRYSFVLLISEVRYVILSNWYLFSITCLNVLQSVFLYIFLIIKY